VLIGIDLCDIDFLTCIDHGMFEIPASALSEFSYDGIAIT
jgi:hypothetical protein